MKKSISVLAILILMTASLFAAQFLSVPLTSNAYRVIEVAQLRGIIPPQSDVKPYPASLVISLLEEIHSSDAISNSEKIDIENLLNSLNDQFGNEENRTNLLKKGYFRTAENGSSATLGIRIFSEQKLGLKLDLKHSDVSKILDSRNGGTFYFNGDLFNAFSYNVNVSAMLDRRDENAYLPNEFPIFADGNYFRGNGSGGFSSGIVWGMAEDPEIATSLFDNKLILRFGSVQRDWGVGDENFALSSSASEFSALELYMKPAKWIDFAVLQGSFQKFALGGRNAFGIKWLSDQYHEDKYDNNYSLHRVTLNLKNLQLSAYESVVWRKRNELSYYNPFAIYMFVQNELSDYDSMLCGIDFDYTFKNQARFYGAMGMTEFNSLSLSTFFTHARHVLSFQGGVEVPAPIGNFGKFTVQATYLPPFYGTHYTWLKENPDNPFGTFTTTFVNKGHTFSYPLYPDSIELKVKFDTSFKNNLDISLEIKDQMRSAQYALDNKNGTTYSTCMDYGIEKEQGYEDKDFFHHIWRNTVALKAEATKKLHKDSPISITFGFDGIVDWKRDYVVEGKYSLQNTQIWKEEPYLDPEKVEFANVYNYGDVYNRGGADMGKWNVPTFSLMAHIGIKIYY